MNVIINIIIIIIL